MLQGDPLEGGWQDEHVKEALDLCLACKGCKGDCPVSVDMATYKAEFLSHYYEGHRRPITAYSFGLIPIWARLAALMPRVVNTVTQTPALRDLAKLAAGMPSGRSIPPFAPRTFQQWFAERSAPAGAASRPPVLLWPDTFNNHFHPETAIAAVNVLERAGYRVIVPDSFVCCGRPLYDYGMLDTAKSWLRRTLRQLAEPIQAGVPMVGLEPSCVAVFRDELRQMLPEDEGAKRLASQTLTLAEFLEGDASRNGGFHPPALRRRAVLHGHCHQKAIMKMGAERQVLKELGLEYEVLDSGCCGMAGSFGFERSHYDVSKQVGELVLLPAVRQQPKDTLIVADGFSCRQQIAQLTDRRALHLAQVIDMAYAAETMPQAADLPERGRVEDYADARLPAPVVAGAVTAIAAIAALSLRRKRR
jgi:Fe-S oxidoreductase